MKKMIGKYLTLLTFKNSITIFLVLLTSAVMAASNSSFPNSETFSEKNLRGYGKVSADFKPNRAVFKCENAEKADILFGKLLADLTWDLAPDAKKGEETDAGGRKIRVYHIPLHGTMAMGKAGDTVIILDGANTASVVAAMAKDPLLSNPQSRFTPDKPYPIYLDCLDLQSVKFYTHAFSSVLGEGLSNHWEFLKKFKDLGISYNLGGGMYSEKSPAPGIMNFVNTDYEVREAERNNGIIIPSFSVGGGLPIWASNLFPDSILKFSPTTVADHHNLCRMESYGTPRNEREETGLWSMYETLRRYQNSPAIGGWQIYNGPAGIEIGANYEPGTDFSKTGIESYRSYLQKIKKLDLRSVGLRYRNDPNAFHSWNEVMPMDVMAFYGNLDTTCLHLRNGQWQPADSSTSEPPPASSPAWRNIDFAPSYGMHTVPVGDTFYRITFDATNWLAKNKGKELYLVCGQIMPWQNQRPKIWLNQKTLETPPVSRENSLNEPFSVTVTGQLKPGSNELYLFIPKGKILSPLFLTPHKPERYPTSDPTLNARYVDLIDWQWYSLGVRHDEMFALARAIDPDRPMTMASGSTWEAAEAMSEIGAKHSVTLQNTGREAYYQPWWARLGRVAGFYGTCEPGSSVTLDITKAASINRLMGQILIDGDSSLIFFWSLEYYIKGDRETQWISNHHRLLSMVGKSLPRPPAVVILRSANIMRYTLNGVVPDPLVWDLGRGELNDLHLNWGYASERELELGRLAGSKVVIDSGTTIMNQTTVEAIERFVKGGGTFVSLHNTGRHDPIKANSWPISRLTGCETLPGTGSGNIRFEKNIGFFTSLAGREFNGDGTALDWKKNDYAKQASIRLKPTAPDVQILAKWPDGSAAVTARPLGKGRIFTLGSTFWRDATDVEGAWVCGKPELLEEILSGIGVERRVNVSRREIWINDSVTKNGLDNWYITFNTVRTPVAADIDFPLAEKPEKVMEVISMKPVPFTYSNGRVALKDVNFTNNETKIFAIARPGIVSGLPAWWEEKTKYWAKTDVPLPPLNLAHDPVKNGTIKLDEWRFLADRNDSAKSGTWKSPNFDDSSWDKIITGPWNSIREDLRDYTGTGLYRIAFDVPSAWNGSSVFLYLYGNLHPAILGNATFYLNGKKIEDESFLRDTVKPTRSPIRTPITQLLVRGKNVLAVEIKGGASHAKEIFSGFGGTVYVNEVKTLEPSTSLKDGWHLIQSDGNSSSLTVPAAKANGQFLRRTFDIPSTWNNIYLRVNTDTQWLTAVAINGQVVMITEFRSYGKNEEFNITPFVELGKPCRIELWGKTFAREGEAKSVPVSTEMNLQSVEIGCLKK